MKKGDKVRVKTLDELRNTEGVIESLGDFDTGDGDMFVSDMYKFCGKKTEIVETWTDAGFQKHRLKISKNEWNFTAGMLVKL